MAFTSGTRLGRYEIRSLLGMGGMGEVYLAHDTQLGRTVALKVLPAKVAGDIGSVRRFTQEAKAASALNHPHILTIFEVGQTDSRHFIVTEFIEGETLRQRMHGTLKLGDVLTIAAQICDALSAAHEAGIVHRDVKPENIMVRRRDGYIKVLDFGLAKLIELQAVTVDTEAPTRAAALTDPGTVLGTVQYMSPEQARGQPVDARTDIFSLGVVLFEMVTGRTPFEGETKTDVVNSIINAEPAPMARYAREVPDTLEWIVSKALRKDKEERYQTARELLTDLRSLKQRLEFAAEQERSVPPMSYSQATMTTAGAHGPISTLKSADAQTEEAARRMSSAEYLASEIKKHKRGAILILAALIPVLAGTVIGLKYISWNRKTSEPFSRIKLTRLTNTGKGRWASISPDGKYVVHIVGDPGRMSVWLRHIATGSEKEIAPSLGGVTYCCPVFSLDGNYVYYFRPQSNVPSVGYQVPVLGGDPKKIIEDVDSQPTFSPDGKRLAFIRGHPDEGSVDLIAANVDATGEQKISTYDLSYFFVTGVPLNAAWSPDGENIVLGVPATDTSGLYRRMIAVRVKDGKTTEIGSQRWYALGQFAWFRDGSGLIFTGSDQPSGSPVQIWYISYPAGQTHKLTNDLNDYRVVSLTADSSALVTVPLDRLSTVWLAPNGDSSRAVQITSNKYDGLDGVAFVPDGRVVYTARTGGGRANLWIANADGTDQRQLTADDHPNFMPAVTPDGRYVVFVSNRAGTQNIWRVDIDGANPTQLTRGQADAGPNLSPDSQWVAYASNDNGTQTLWKVPINGGNPVRLTDFTSATPIISPDGKQIACSYLDFKAKPTRQLVAIIPFEGGQPIKTFDIVMRPLRLRWTPDGKALIYNQTRAGVSNLWRQPIEGGAPVQLTDFKSDQIYFFDWTRDGNQLCLARGSSTSDVVLISDLK